MSDLQSNSPADKPSARVAAGLAPPAEDDLDLGELLRQLWRRKLAVLGTVVTVTTLAAIIVFQLTPRYTATVAVMIEPRETQVVDIEAVMSGLPRDFATIQSEVEVIRSRGLADRVIRKLKLLEDPEFNSDLRPKTAWEELRDELFDVRAYVPEEWLDIVFGAPEQETLTREEKLDRKRIETIDHFLARLEVRPARRSRVITISFESENPQTAALVANTVADLYLIEQLEAKFEATQRATIWLSGRLAGLRQKVEASERAVEKFRKKAGLIEGERVTLAVQEISELNTELLMARSKGAEAEARLKQLEARLRSSGNVDSVAEVLSSSLVQHLREQEAEVLRKAAELSTQYGEKHPRIINVRAEIRDLRSKIMTEADKITENLRSEAALARTRERALTGRLRQLEKKIARLNESRVQLRALEREAEANRALYQTFLTRFKETRAREDIQQTDARIISRADVPSGPSFPKKRLILALAFAGAIFLGVAFAFFIERLDQGFRSMEQMERLAGISPLGLVPALKGLRAHVTEPEDYMVAKPESAFGESIRSLQIGVQLSNIDRPPKVVLVTSALPAEGKTVIALSLARMKALAGEKAIVVESDLRRPILYKKLQLPKEPGLVEYLADQASLADIIHQDEATGAHILPAGRPTPNSSNLLNSDRMKSLLAELSARYDLVVLDSPPVLAVGDARILAHLADKTIFIVRWAETRREVAMLGLRQIAEAGGDIAGFVLSRVNVKKHARYGYGDSGYYYGRYTKYYTG